MDGGMPGASSATRTVHPFGISIESRPWSSTGKVWRSAGSRSAGCREGPRAAGAAPAGRAGAASRGPAQAASARAPISARWTGRAAEGMVRSP
ncbi:MAG: hypothetical protein QM704_07255 [Anaeromyxobacteraceae bacterium]